MKDAPDQHPADALAGLRDWMRRDLRTAMKAREPAIVSALRTTLAALDNAEAVEVPPEDGALGGPVAGARAGVGSTEVARRTLSMDEVLGVLEEQITDRLAAADQYEALNRWSEAERLRQEGSVIRGYLPG